MLAVPAVRSRRRPTDAKRKGWLERVGVTWQDMMLAGVFGTGATLGGPLSSQIRSHIWSLSTGKILIHNTTATHRYSRLSPVLGHRGVNL